MPSVASAFSMLLPCQVLVFDMHNLYFPLFFFFCFFLLLFFFLYVTVCFLKRTGCSRPCQQQTLGLGVESVQVHKVPLSACWLLHILMKLECTHCSVAAVIVSSNTAVSLSTSKLKLVGFDILKLLLVYLGTP